MHHEPAARNPNRRRNRSFSVILNGTGRGLAALLFTGLLVGCSGGGISRTPPPGLEFPEDESVETVLRAVDGDTFELSSSGIVRLIGINTPESVKPGAPVECHGKEASEAAARLTGKTVRIEIDDVAGERDRYGRRLVYLWYLQDGAWIHYNLEAVTNGDARSYAFDDQQYLHRAAFEAAEQVARSRGIGLWSCG